MNYLLDGANGDKFIIVSTQDDAAAASIGRVVRSTWKAGSVRLVFIANSADLSLWTQMLTVIERQLGPHFKVSKISTSGKGGALLGSAQGMSDNIAQQLMQKQHQDALKMYEMLSNMHKRRNEATTATVQNLRG